MSAERPDQPAQPDPTPPPIFAEPLRPTPAPTLRGLFLGDDGLRAGWSVLLFLLIAWGLSVAAGFLIAHLHLLPKRAAALGAADMTPYATTVSECVGFAVFGLAALLMSLIERRPFHQYGIPVRHALPDFALGLVWGFTFITGLAGALLLTHHLAFDGELLHGAVAWRFAAEWGLAFLFVGLLEEFLFRGYLQYTVARGIAGIARAMSVSSPHTYAIGFAAAAFLFSVVLFALAHVGNGGETATGLLAVAAAGITFAYSLWRTGSLWWAIGFHTTWDWGQTYFYGTPDSARHGVGHLLGSHPMGSALLSGGTDGPEGSIFVLPTLLLVCLVIHLTLPFRPRFLTPDQQPPELSR